MIEARYYKKLDDGTVECLLCPHTCKIKVNKTGICRARKNIDGILHSLTYNEFTSVALDPIEKKPLYHFFPGSKILSFGSIGCNFKCLHCQNSDISQAEFGDIPTNKITPKEAVNIAKKYKSIGIAYTYNEPLINFEWIYETSKIAKSEGLKNVLVTNGYINSEPFNELIEYIDAANVDVKSFRDDFYRKVCSAKLEPVLEFVKKMYENKKHVEVTNLIIPKYNDNFEEINDLIEWLYEINPSIPLHFSRYFPHYKLNEPPTPFLTLKSAYELAIKKLKYVYIGNVWENGYSNTYCPNCKSIVIKRIGYNTIILLRNKNCSKCGCKIDIILE